MTALLLGAIDQSVIPSCPPAVVRRRPDVDLTRHVWSLRPESAFKIRDNIIDVCQERLRAFRDREVEDDLVAVEFNGNATNGRGDKPEHRLNYLQNDLVFPPEARTRPDLVHRWIMSHGAANDRICRAAGYRPLMPR